MNARSAIRSEWTRFRTSRSTIWTTVTMTLVMPVFAVFVALTGSLEDDDTILGGSLTGAVNAQVLPGIVGG